MSKTYTTSCIVAAVAALSAPAACEIQVLPPAAEDVVEAPGNTHSESSWFGSEAPLPQTIVEILCFCVAFMCVRHMTNRLPSKKKGARPSPKKVVDSDSDTAVRTQPMSALQIWRLRRQRGPVHGQDLVSHASRVFGTDPESYVQEFVGHLEGVKEPKQLCDDLHALMDVLAKAGRPELSVSMARLAGERFGLNVEADHIHRCMLTGYSSAGCEAKVEELLEEERRTSPVGQVAVRSLALAARGFLKHGKADAALSKFIEMAEHGNEVPPRAVSELFHVAHKTGVVKKTFESISGSIPLTADAISTVSDHSFENNDFELAQEVERLATEQGTDLPNHACQCLLKLYVKWDENKSMDVFERMKRANFDLAEGFCRFVMARCADSKYLQLAEHIARFLRERGEMTFLCYKTLMKVYAFCNEFDKACDLYTEIKAKSMALDSVMLGSLIKFAAKAGRADLFAELAEKFDGTCIKNYMLLIRLAGQDGDVQRALATFRKLQTNSPELVDSMAYNVTLDACVTNQDMDKAHELLEEMHRKHAVNLVTYNTLIKGYCIGGKIDRANAVLREMQTAGVEPDAASFSCLLSGAAKALNYPEVARVLDHMDRRGVPLDSYITSTMMQLARKLPDKRDALRALAIVDRPDIKIFEDEVVFNTVLDACIYRRDMRRLTRTVDGYSNSKIRASIRTYGLLIKACAVLHRTQNCWTFWSEMVDERSMQPNDVTLGCMIDALVEAGRVEEALALFQDWKTKVSCDTIIYSTLIKGFAQMHDPDRAMALYRDMKDSGVQMNHIAFTTLINAHAKKGLMKRAEQLVEEMREYGCKPNAITYSSLIRGHCVRGDLSAALDIFHKMIGEGFEADCVIYNTLLDGCVQNQNWRLGEELLAEMKAAKVSRSNFTLSIVVKMWSKRGELDKAFAEVYGALKDPEGPMIDAQVGACIVGACIHNKDGARALEVFADMKTWPNFDGPDANTYSAMISGLPRFGYLREAVEVTKEACVALKAMPGYDKKPLASRALLQLFRALRNERLLSEIGHQLADNLRDAGMPVEDWWLNAPK